MEDKPITFCYDYWALYDIWTDLVDARERGISIDPKAVMRAKAAMDKHKRECPDCGRKGEDVG